MESEKKKVGRPMKKEVSKKTEARRKQRAAKKAGTSVAKGRPKKKATQSQSQRQVVSQVVNVRVGDTAKKRRRAPSKPRQALPPASIPMPTTIIQQQPPQPDFTGLFQALQQNFRPVIQETNPLAQGVSNAFFAQQMAGVQAEERRAGRTAGSFVPPQSIPEQSPLNFNVASNFIKSNLQRNAEQFVSEQSNFQPSGAVDRRLDQDLAQQQQNDFDELDRAEFNQKQRQFAQKPDPLSRSESDETKATFFPPTRPLIRTEPDEETFTEDPSPNFFRYKSPENLVRSDSGMSELTDDTGFQPFSTPRRETAEEIERFNRIKEASDRFQQEKAEDPDLPEESPAGPAEADSPEDSEDDEAEEGIAPLPEKIVPKRTENVGNILKRVKPDGTTLDIEYGSKARAEQAAAKDTFDAWKKSGDLDKLTTSDINSIFGNPSDAQVARKRAYNMYINANPDKKNAAFKFFDQMTTPKKLPPADVVPTPKPEPTAIEPTEAIPDPPDFAPAVKPPPPLLSKAAEEPEMTIADMESRISFLSSLSQLSKEQEIEKDLLKKKYAAALRSLAKESMEEFQDAEDKTDKEVLDEFLEQDLTEGLTGPEKIRFNSLTKRKDSLTEAEKKERNTLKKTILGRLSIRNRQDALRIAIRNKGGSDFDDLTKNDIKQLKEDLGPTLYKAFIAVHIAR